MATPAPPLLTLTTDFGREDLSPPPPQGPAAQRPARAAAQSTSATTSPTYDIVRAAFVVNKVWRHFPRGTVHLLSVNDYYQPRGRFLATCHEGHYFIGPDNGIFSLLFGLVPEQTFVLDGYAADAPLYASTPGP